MGRNIRIRLSLLLSVAFALCEGDSEDLASDCKAAVKGTVIEKFSGTRIWKITDKKNVYGYEIGVCNNVGSGGEAVIQRVNSTVNKGKAYVVGRLRGAHVITRRDYAELEYFNGDKYSRHCNTARRTARIIFVCDPCGTGEGGPSVVEEVISKNTESDNTHCFYLFEWPTPLVCSRTHYTIVFCSRPHLSTGSVLLVLFFSALAIYVVAGCLYKRSVYHARGTDQFPNVSFWRECGTLMSDGCDFLCRSGPPLPVKAERMPSRSDYHLDAEESEDDVDDLLPM